MKRRKVLAGAAALPIGMALAGCGGRFNSADNQIQLLDRSIPLRLVRAFQRQKPPDTQVSFETRKTFLELFEQLRAWQAAPAANRTVLNLPLPGNRTASTQQAELLSLGDYWLRPAIQEKLIQPLPINALQAWTDLAPAWQELMRRDRNGFLSPQGEVWGLPYRWGYLQIIYNRRHFEALGWQPQGWADLLRPELRGRMALPDHPRIVLGLALKLLGASANATDPQAVAGLAQRLTALHQQTRFYSSDHYLEPLVLEDISLAVGWSTDILPVAQEYRQFEALMPEEGTLLTADLWVKPAPLPDTAPSQELSAVTQAWLQYCLDPQAALELTLYSLGASPLFWNQEAAALPEALRNRPLLTLTPETQQRSEFLLPLAEPVQRIYDDLWLQMRSALV
ncbi:MAG: extracellular solute-binding protein [Cyanobacteria bacterium Co-bin13]|nr:extracellular solute-binding protein [Cyanobacteria bacterium Co-bin13]